MKKLNYKNVLNHKSFTKNKGITLIALILIIVMLLILADIVIMQLNNNGLLKNSKISKEKYKVAKQDEENKLNEYSSNINLETTRDNSSKIKTLWSGQVAQENAEIALNESYKKYDELIFYLGYLNSKNDLYSTMTLLTQYIDEDNNNFSRGAWGCDYVKNYISFKFKDEKNIIITATDTPPCIYRIVGVKF